jgi:hypothetical protein
LLEAFVDFTDAWLPLMERPHPPFPEVVEEVTEFESPSRTMPVETFPSALDDLTELLPVLN